MEVALETWERVSISDALRLGTAALRSFLNPPVAVAAVGQNWICNFFANVAQHEGFGSTTDFWRSWSTPLFRPPATETFPSQH
jgi:hypothetical protein